MSPLVPTSNSATGNATTMTQKSSVGQAPTVQPTDSLWEKAVKALGDEDKRNVDFNRTDKLAILKDVLKAVDEKKRTCLDKRWRYKKGNRAIIIRDQLEKVVEWVNKFKEIGDIAVQYDPAHAALPWAGVRFFLQVAVNDSQTFGAIVEGMELVSNIITRYTIFEKLYLRTITGAAEEVAAQDQLTQALLKLYIAVLKYLSNARRYYDRHTAERLIRSVVETAESTVDVYISKISKEKADVDACARLVEVTHHYNINDGVQRLETILRQLEKPIKRSATQLSDLHDSLKSE